MPITPVSDRLQNRLAIEDNGCWRWTGLLDHDGYGRFWTRGRWRILHRVAYETLRGPIPDGLTIDHLCRNRACFNPEHLEPVTLQENQRRGRAVSPKTHCIHGHVYDEANTTIDGNGARRCKTCARQKRRIYVAKRRAFA